MKRLTLAWQRLFVRFLIWGLDMDITLLEDRAKRCAEDRAEFIRRRSDLIVELINLDAEAT